jgi:hypothetical protein
MPFAKSSLVVGAMCIALSGCVGRFASSPLPAGVRVVEYRGGKWFDGTTFAERTMYVVGDTFRERRPSRVDSVVDLAGRFVVPPFADAHQHLAEPAMVGLYIANFLRDGIYYVKDQSNAPSGRRVIDTAVNKPTSIDFISANQGWTSPGGHPVEIMRRGVQMGIVPAAWIRDSLDYGALMLVDTPDDVARHWPVFLASTPKADFVKVYLLSSEEYAQRRKEPKYEGNRGMDPALVPDIVRRAHAAGLQVSAHVSTAADFRVAVMAGVDQLAHLPGQRANNSAPYLLTDADAEAAAAAHVTVVTTVSMRSDSALTDRIMRDVYAHNIDVLRKHGVPLLIGSDIMRGTSATEIAALARSGLFTNLELLRLWSVVTPQAIFPARKIGVLADGYEASFLVLGADPLRDVRATSGIVLRVKQGVALK